MYEILLHRNAAKAYENLDNRTVARINKSIDVLKENPFYGKDIKKLRGRLVGRYRLRVGRYSSNSHFEKSLCSQRLETAKKAGIAMIFLKSMSSL
ncbi:MAG: hypothetical protein C5S48_10080 [Candidatus Methanogaster sp.]|nr:MAG: hypothetical protein C5S48_10080 [ANME-2 cluster archaeon]